MDPVIIDEMYEIRLLWRWKDYLEGAEIKTYGGRYLVRGYACVHPDDHPNSTRDQCRRIARELSEDLAVSRLACKFATDDDGRWYGFADVEVSLADTFYQLEQYDA